MYRNLKKIISLYLFFTIFSLKTYDLTIAPLNLFLEKNQEVAYIPCFNEHFFEYQPFPLSINQANHPHFGNFEKTYILKFPHGIVQSMYGFVPYKNQFIQEFIWKGITRHLNLIEDIPSDNIISIPGKVAVISQLAYFNYWHWISEVLCRLALLELQNIEYDYLYVNQENKFMKDTLQLWGIPSEKIIAPKNNQFAIQAEEVYLPSLVSNVNFGFAAFSCYAQPHLIKYVKNKLLNAALNYKPSQNFSKKIFISRKDSNIRNIINEDEFFEKLKIYGFERYELAKLSVTDQILLFNQADIIVSPQGTGLANSIFSKPNAIIIELFQALNDATFWYLAQDFNFNYKAIKTTNFYEDYITAWQSPTAIPLEVVDIIENIL